MLRSQLALLHRFSLSPPAFARRSDASCMRTTRTMRMSRSCLPPSVSLLPCLKSIDTFTQCRPSNVTRQRAAFKFYRVLLPPGETRGKRRTKWRLVTMSRPPGDRLYRDFYVEILSPRETTFRAKFSARDTFAPFTQPEVPSGVFLLLETRESLSMISDIFYDRRPLTR